ncbi:hypothetical protein CARUB_v10011812mg [Capsella rubella]|uniref:Uncharacterized protein n=1 Tax=Capsella rubella TaxID=81985 RepID=R0IGS3_9BRAS|nr:uncharacterized protein LOC17900292 [Capsella rubella]EOA37550.1 hypothetical protein CARUB_v10011812mg [Capsella rubella]
MIENNKVTSFCEETSACRDEALYFLECFSWNLDDAISGFLGDQLPPLKRFPRSQGRRLKELKYRSRLPLKRRHSSATSVSGSKNKMVQDEMTILRSSSYTAALAKSVDDGRELDDSDVVPHRQKIVSIYNPVKQEFKQEGASSATATMICEPTSIEIDFPCSDSD